MPEQSCRKESYQVPRAPLILYSKNKEPTSTLNTPQKIGRKSAKKPGATPAKSGYKRPRVSTCEPDSDSDVVVSDTRYSYIVV